MYYGSTAVWYYRPQTDIGPDRSITYPLHAWQTQHSWTGLADVRKAVCTSKGIRLAGKYDRVTRFSIYQPSTALRIGKRTIRSRSLCRTGSSSKNRSASESYHRSPNARMEQPSDPPISKPSARISVNACRAQHIQPQIRHYKYVTIQHWECLHAIKSLCPPWSCDWLDSFAAR